MNLPGVSIVICTYNGKTNLSPTLEHIAAQQKINDVAVELLLIDNASTDGTTEFVQSKWATLQTSIALRIIQEPKPGKGNASVTGFNACKYEVIIVCDDDNYLCADYVKRAYDLMCANKNIGVMGGKSEPIFEDTKPVWFYAQQHIFAVGEQFDTNGKNVGFLWGAGMVFRKTAWDTLQQLHYTFFLNEQRSGKLNWGGDDTELCEMITVLGYDLWYDNTLVLQHYMPKQRMTKEYLHSRYFGIGRSRIYTHAYVHCRLSNEVPKKELKYALWLDRYIHKTKERLQILPHIILKMSEEANQDVLNYISLKGELMELWRIKNNYTAVFRKILEIKKRIAELKK